jgi:hypothetical protein
LLNSNFSGHILEYAPGSQAFRRLLRLFVDVSRIEEVLEVAEGKRSASSVSGLVASSIVKAITSIGSSPFGTSPALIE